MARPIPSDPQKEPATALRRLLHWWRNVAAPRLATAFGWLAVIYISATMLFQFDSDTTDVSGAAFVIVSILAGLAFTYAGIIPEGRDKLDVIYSGERLFQGAMLFIAGSLLKYAALAIPTQLKVLPDSSHAAEFAIHLLQALALVVLLAALLSSQLGYSTLGRVLLRRMAHRDPEGFFPRGNPAD